MSLLPSGASLAIPEGRSPVGFWLECWSRALIFPICVWIMAASSSPPRAPYLALAGLVSLFWFSTSRWLWRVQLRLRDYRALAGRRTVVHYPPGFSEVDALPEFLRRCEAERDDLTELFGFSLRRRWHVFVVPTRWDIAALFGRPFGGTVWVHANAVLLTPENLNRGMLRHELGHLFSARWNPAAPPILSEGLSTWLEGDCGRMVDDEVCRIRLWSRPDLEKLLDREFFYSASHRYVCYTLAGSFTGFLIRRYGWDRYLDFYRKSRPTRFELGFRKYFGLSLMEAQRRWLAEILSMSSLNRRLRDDRLFNEFE